MINLGLQRIARLLANTKLTWDPIHVAGTNGKGSICAYISSMLDAYNKTESVCETSSDEVESCPKRELRHGRFTSPHLIDRWDGIVINQQPVSFSIFDEVEQAVLRRNQRHEIGASQFEIMTATAFEIFEREKLDVGVVEVGLGGRLDATNILGQPRDVSEADLRTHYSPLPLVTAIGSIGLDHQTFLGNSLEAIAREKAGIIKPGVPVVYDSANDPRVVKVIREVAQANKCAAGAFYENSRDSLSFQLGQAAAGSGTHIGIHSDRYPARYKEIRPSTLASPMKNNLDVAFHATCAALMQLRPWLLSAETKMDDIMEVAPEMVKAALATPFPGRQQKLSIEKLTGRAENVLLDGAHNAQSATALAKTVRFLRGKSPKIPVTWLIAASDSRDPKDILVPLLRNGDAVFAVQFGPVDGMPWVKPASTSSLLSAAKASVSNADSLSTHDCGSDVLAALRAASHQADGGPLVIAGSLYLVGDVLRLLRGG